MILGVDEAGRGPVLGPMVMAACAIDKKDVSKLITLGVKDSKLLTRKQRENFFEQVKKLCKHATIIVPPSDVDKAVNSKKDNLNLLEARTTAKLIEQLAKKHDIEKAIIDCPSINTKKYTQTMQSLIAQEMEVICEHKADMNYPIVAAASILAKVVRDREMQRISELAKEDIGSGYMTDPKTHAWLQTHYDGDYGFIRRSWASIKNLQEERAQTSLDAFSNKEQEHQNIKKEFSKLEKFGFSFITPKTQYEIVRMKGPENVAVTIIKYTTGKLLVQGSEKEKLKANALLQTVGIEEK